jgi:hypothetical protein
MKVVKYSRVLEQQINLSHTRANYMKFLMANKSETCCIVRAKNIDKLNDRARVHYAKNLSRNSPPFLRNSTAVEALIANLNGNGLEKNVFFEACKKT